MGMNIEEVFEKIASHKIKWIYCEESKKYYRVTAVEITEEQQKAEEAEEEAKKATMKKEIGSLLKHICEQSYPPPRNGYTYFFPSPNEGKRLLITGWIDPSEAALIAENILLGKKTVHDYDCVEEIDLEFKE